MRLTILGSGAMGCLFGGYLSRSGADVLLVDSWQEHVDALNARPLLLWEGDEQLEIPVRAVAAGRAVRPADVVLLFVKAHQTASAVASLPALLDRDGRVATLQNGLGSADLLAEALGPERVLAGVTAQGATLLGPGEIRHGGGGDTQVGGYRGPSPWADALAETLSNARLPCRAVEDIWPAIWRKLVVNCGINALTALTGIRNGRIPEIPEAAALLRAAVAEAAAVAGAAAVDLGDPDALADHVLAVARATAANRSSMGQDVDRRAATEIDFINGAVVREAARRGVPVPVNTVLAQLVKTLERSF